MDSISVLQEQMTTTFPISVSTISGKSSAPRYAHFMLGLYAKAAGLRLCYLYCKKSKKWIGKLTNSQAGQKALSGRIPNPTEMGIQQLTSLFRKVSLELSAVGN